MPTGSVNAGSKINVRVLEFEAELPKIELFTVKANV